MSGNLTYLRKLLQYLPDASKPDSALFPVHDFFRDFEDVFDWEFIQARLSNGRLAKFFWRQPVLRHQCIYTSPLAIASVAPDASGFEELLRNGFRADVLTWAEITGHESFPHLELLVKYQQRLDVFLPSPPKLATPLSIAVDSRNKELVEGANINTPPATQGGDTALQLAARYGYLGMARELIGRGARINARGAKENGRTALEGAAQQGRLDMLEFLIHHGALLTGNGRIQFLRAVKLARGAGFHAAVSLLKRHGGWTKDDERRLTAGWYHLYPDESCCDELHDFDTECIHDSFDSKTGSLEIRQISYNEERTFPECNVNREIYGNMEYSDDDDDDDCMLSGE
ncbi:hypothetical protein NW762_003933 [Fusarium torreyae]|uniref:Ankyrin n=1 Tax=Fusarium torreyae TaxID=1237075 RepID=A0A9W8S666_9HYPO|nr:hypothetical protein NW762_003933 [Fusarium torreyae]